MNSTLFSVRLLRLAVVLLFAGVVSPSCSARTGMEAPELIRLDEALAGFDSLAPEQAAALTDSLMPALSAMAAVGITEGVSPKDISAYVNSRAFAFFEPAVKERFTQGDSLGGVIAAERSAFAKHLPAVHFPAIYGIVSPYNQSIVTTDSVMLVALNHYLGRNYEAYSYFEPYLRRMKEPRLMPYHIAEALVMRDYPMQGDSATTALAYMLHDGAVMEAMLRIVPESTAADAGGWSAEEYKWLQSNEAAIWKELLDKGMLKSTDRLDIARLINPAPATMSLSGNAPGRAGRYIGHRLVSEYLRKHPEASLADLLSPGWYTDSDVARLIPSLMHR